MTVLEELERKGEAHYKGFCLEVIRERIRLTRLGEYSDTIGYFDFNELEVKEIMQWVDKMGADE